MEWQINMFHDCSYTVDAVKNFTMDVASYDYLSTINWHHAGGNL